MDKLNCWSVPCVDAMPIEKVNFITLANAIIGLNVFVLWKIEYFMVKS